MMYPSHDDWVYTAGLVDADGSITVTQSPRRWNPLLVPSFLVRLQVTNTYEPIVRWLADVFGGRVVANRKMIGRRKVFVWMIDGQAAIGVLQVLRQHLRIKAAQAWLAMEAWEQRGNLRRGDDPAQVAALRRGFVLASSYLNHAGAA